ncbi:MAG: hypothetical protein ACM31C_01880 [Acidobacteriota bacterium]
MLVSAASRADAERIFAAFWSGAFGVVVDRFGTPGRSRSQRAERRVTCTTVTCSWTFALDPQASPDLREQWTWAVHHFDTAVIDRFWHVRPVLRIAGSVAMLALAAVARFALHRPVPAEWLFVAIAVAVLLAPIVRALYDRVASRIYARRIARSWDALACEGSCTMSYRLDADRLGFELVRGDVHRRGRPIELSRVAVAFVTPNLVILAEPLWHQWLRSFYGIAFGSAADLARLVEVLEGKGVRIIRANGPLERLDRSLPRVPRAVHVVR